MLSVDRQQNITLTRSDSAFIDVVELKNIDGENYQYSAGDKVYFRVNSSPMIEKELTIDLENNMSSLLLVPDDTKDLAFTTYKYEMELVTSAGCHYTFISYKSFSIGNEVENHNGTIGAGNSQNPPGGSVANAVLIPRISLTGEIGAAGPHSYLPLSDKPQINGVELIGNKTNGDLGIPDTLAELPDVDLNNVVGGEILKYNATTGKWKNASDTAYPFSIVDGKVCITFDT